MRISDWSSDVCSSDLRWALLASTALDPGRSARHCWLMAEETDFSSLSFEDALKRLEAIVQQLESGDVPLDQSITLYAEGRSEERRVGKECVSPCRSRWSPDP